MSLHKCDLTEIVVARLGSGGSLFGVILYRTCIGSRFGSIWK